MVIAWVTRHIWWRNGVRLVLLRTESFIRLHAFDENLYPKGNSTKNINNARLRPTKDDPCYEQAQNQVIPGHHPPSVQGAGNL